MPVSFTLPDRVEAQLRRDLGGDLDQAAKEALAIDMYRTGRISVGVVAEMLGMSVIAAQDWLAQRGAPLNYTAADLHSDQRTLDQLLGQ